MNRTVLIIFLASVIVFLVVLGCASGGSGGSGDSDTDSDTDGDGDSDSDSDGDDGPPIDPGANLDEIAMIDNMEDGDTWIRQWGGRYGMWYLFNDGTSGGSQIPSGDFEMTEGGFSGSNYSASSSGSGFTDWGAGIGFDLSNPAESDCEGAPPEGRNPYDASSFDGITFWAKGTNKLRVALPTPDTLPSDSGGECTSDCDDNFGRDFTLNSEWTQYAFMFENMEQEGWGASAELDVSSIISIMFQVDADQDFDFSIDDVAFFGAEDEEGTWETGDGTNNGIDDLTLAAGFRASSYGIEPFPDREYWASVGLDMADKFDGATPSAVWIVGEIITGSENPSDNGKTKLNFPKPAGDYPDVEFDACDMNEATLNLFDELGYKIWLQVEPGYADIATLIDLVLTRYSHHPCVIGFGVDVEWFNTVTGTDAEAVSDGDAVYWRGIIQEYNPNYSLMLKHWQEWMMPPSERNGLFFLDDAQGVGSLANLGAVFEEWADNFSPAPVGFQVGYESDESWWGGMSDPVQEIGQYLLDANSNMKGFFWVDFTLQTVFPE